MDDLGHVWVRRYKRVRDLSERWVVFDPDRRPQNLILPPGFELMDVRGDLAAGVWKDDFDVEHVWVYRLQRGS